jgi:hypothetical protein
MSLLSTYSQAYSQIIKPHRRISFRIPQAACALAQSAKCPVEKRAVDIMTERSKLASHTIDSHDEDY